MDARLGGRHFLHGVPALLDNQTIRITGHTGTRWYAQRMPSDNHGPPPVAAIGLTAFTLGATVALAIFLPTGWSLVRLAFVVNVIVGAMITVVLLRHKYQRGR